MLLGIFVAAQAPVLFSRDLRHGTIALYLARPLRSDTYAVARWASLFAATLVFLLAPLLLLYAVAVLGQLDAAEQTRDLAVAVGSPCCSACSPRGRRRADRLVVDPARVRRRRDHRPAAHRQRRRRPRIQAIARRRAGRGIGEVAGLFSPYSLYRGLMASWTDVTTPTPPLEHGHGAGLRRGVFVGLSAACVAALLWRYRRVATVMSVLTLDRASRWYGNVVAVNGISMTVGPGVTGLLGPNGAGKTTLIALMSGFLAPSAGTATLDGEPIWRHTDAYRTIGLVPERELGFGYLTGRQFVRANAELHGLDDPGAATERALEVVDMTEPAERRIGTYSKGMRQRVKLASALVHDPAVLLLDEPFNGVDPRQRLHLMSLLRRMGSEGRTVLFSSHILEEVEQVARQIEVVVSGRHAASGDFGQIRRLMTDRPVQYVVVADDDRRLATALIAEPSVVAVSLRPGGGVAVSVSDFGAFAVRLPLVARRNGIRILELTPTDESLESVFAYLVGGDR